MQLYYITDRLSLDRDLIDVVAEALEAGVDFIQIREKDLAPRDLYDLAVRIKNLANPHGTRILVNERLDIALAAGLDGVHLPAFHAPIRALRAAANRPVTIGVSCHTNQEVADADGASAELVVYAPIFTPASKPALTQPAGLSTLAAVCAAFRVPVFALGGVTEERVRPCLLAGAAGVAGISLFQSATSLRPLVTRLRGGLLPTP